MNWKFWQRKSNKRTAPQIIFNGGGAINNVAFVGNGTEAMKIAAVFTCVKAISDAIARLPLEFRRRNNATGCFVPHFNSSLYQALMFSPNPWHTPYVLMKTLVEDVLLKGNAYLYPVEDESHYVTGLYLLHPSSVSYNKLTDEYIVADSDAGVQGRFSSSKILHFKNESLDGGYTGVSTIAFAARVLGISATGDEETLRQYANGGRMKAIYHQESDGAKGFSGAGMYSNKEMLASAEEMEKRLDSGKNITVVPGAGKLDPLSMSAADMQFLESRKFNISEIARFFRVPRSLLMDDTNSNYKSVAEANGVFFQQALAPLMKMIEDEFNKKLIYDFQRADYKFDFDESALYMGDPAARIDIEAKELANGLRTINEIRQSYGREPLDGGDTPLASANLKSLKVLAEESNETSKNEDNGK